MLHRNLILLNNSIRSIKLCSFTLISLKIFPCLYLAKMENYSSYAQQQNSKGNIITNVRKKESIQYRQLNTKKVEANANKENYFCSIDQTIYKSFPTKYMIATNNVRDKLYFIEKSAAAQFVKLIFNDLSKNMCFVIEANPGLGLLTTNLLEAGVPVLHVYETDIYFLNCLHELKKKYPMKLHIAPYNIFRVSKLQYMDSLYDKNIVQTIFKDVPHKAWEDDCSIQFIGITTNMNFLRYIISCTIFQITFMSYGRASFYIGILPSMWNALTYTDHIKKKYNSMNILFQTLFDYKYFGCINRKSFVPWEKKMRPEDQKSLYVVKIEPKANLFTDYFASAELISYWYFVKYHFRKRTDRVIPALEIWIPGCGIKLISKDINIYTRFMDLTPDQVMEVFKEFSSCPEYETSSFITSMNIYFGNSL